MSGEGKTYDADKVYVELGGVRLRGFEGAERIELVDFKPAIKVRGRGKIGAYSGTFEIKVEADQAAEFYDHLDGQLRAAAHHQRLVASAARRRRLEAKRQVQRLQELLEARRYGRRLPQLLERARQVGARQRQAETAAAIFGHAGQAWLDHHKKGRT